MIVRRRVGDGAECRRQRGALGRHRACQRLLHGHRERDLRRRWELPQRDGHRAHGECGARRPPRRQRSTCAATPRSPSPSRRRSSGRSATSASLTITLSNANAVALTAAAFTDTYPAGLVNTASASGATTCAGGTVTAANNASSVALSGGTIPASGSCSVTVNVTSAATGTYPNSIGARRGFHGQRGPEHRRRQRDAQRALRPCGCNVLHAVRRRHQRGLRAHGHAHQSELDGRERRLVHRPLPGGPPYTPARPRAPRHARAARSRRPTAAPPSHSPGATVPASSSCTITVNVTSGSAGTATSIPRGPSRAAMPAPPPPRAPRSSCWERPTIAKAFAPSGVTLRRASVLTITLHQIRNTTGGDHRGRVHRHVPGGPGQHRFARGRFPAARAARWSRRPTTAPAWRPSRGQRRSPHRARAR